MTTRSCELNEVMLAFLRAELDSPTERTRLLKCLARHCIEEATLRSHGDLDAIAIFEAYRGAETIFTGLDWQGLSWVVQPMSLEEAISCVETCRHNFQARYGTRKLGAVVTQLDDLQRNTLHGVIETIVLGKPLEPPILVRESGAPRSVIVEGHNRMMAYVLESGSVSWPLPVYMGTGHSLSSWVEWDE